METMYFSFKEFGLRNLYNILTHIAQFHLNVIAPFNKKIGLGMAGRKQTFPKLRSTISNDDKVIWFHCASLGEYEQGVPVFEAIKEEYPQHKIVLSFFSPSGYEIKKNSPLADVVVYLPLDTSKNVRKFLDLVHPELVVFVKYEIWPNYLFELQERSIRSILISAVFREDQSYFKSNGRWMLKAFGAFDRIFVQNHISLQLLGKAGITQVELSGDTRFDRVSQQLKLDNRLEFLETFKGDDFCIVAGSTWPEGEALLVDFINQSEEDLKFVIAPHNIKPSQIQALQAQINRPTVLHSQLNQEELRSKQVLILDVVGLLSRTYHYADLAYIGGGFGKRGLHNTLEAAVFGIPIVIGPNYERFPEAIAMIERGGMQFVDNQEGFNSSLNNLMSNQDQRKRMGQLNSTYISENRGAVIQIMDFIRK